MDVMNTHILEKITDIAITFGPKIISSLIVLFVGNWLIKKIIILLKKLFKKNSLDESLQKFLLSLIAWSLKLFLIITVLGQLGVATSSFVAIIGAAGLAIGLALQGSLANFAGGALIMLFKPFKVGDLIEAQGVVGVVKEIQIFTTILTTPENKTVIVPNGALSNDKIVNFTEQGRLRVDLSVGISYDADIKKAKDVLMDVMKKHSLVLNDPEPSVFVTELADSFVNLAVRPWAKAEDYWTVYGDILEQSKNALDEAGIEIPYPQIVLHNK